MKSDTMMYIIIVSCSSRAQRVGCSKNIFAVFAKKERTNFFLFSFFFDFLTRPNRTTDETDRSLHSFTQTGGGFLFETSSSSRVNTFRERTFYSRAKEARLIHARE
jgi:hypothetical protein